MKLPATVDVNDALRGAMLVEVKVVGVKRAKLRILCATILIRLACWLINHDVDIKEV